MRHLEIHILQSFPVSCLNRDDFNQPKTAIFGGVTRARISSQCLKRAIREKAAASPDSGLFFGGKRTRLFIPKIKESLMRLGEDEEKADILSRCAGHYLAKLDTKDVRRVKTMMFLSSLEIDSISKMLFGLDENSKQELVSAIKNANPESFEDEETSDEEEEDVIEEPKVKLTKEDKKKAKDAERKAKFDKAEADNKKKKASSDGLKKIVNGILKNAFKKLSKNGLVSDAADIALFGRMVANDPSMEVEAASMFAHALSVHKSDNEIDYFTAIDDLQPSEDHGAGMTGTIDFNSATYYRFAALNLDMLFDKDHLACLDSKQRTAVVTEFVSATITAIPGARMNTMNGNTLPAYVLIVVRESGHPIQLVNAFENSIRSDSGYIATAISKLAEEYKSLSDTWGIEAVYCKEIPKTPLANILGELAEYVK